MEKISHIPKEYEEALEEIDKCKAGEYPLGIVTFEDVMNENHRRFEGCGCNTCRMRFWRSVEEAHIYSVKHGDSEMGRRVQKEIDGIIKQVFNREDTNDGEE